MYGYSYDPLGNWVTRSNAGSTVYYHHNANNNQESDYGATDTVNSPSNTQFTYDNWGNTVTKNVPGTGITGYQYDVLNRNTGITYPGSTPSSSFGYNLESLRTSKTDSSGSSTSSYDGLDLASETGTNGGLYMWGPMGLTSVVRGGSTYWYLLDLHGSVLRMVDTSVNSVAAYWYDAFGNTRGSNGTLASSNPYRYSGGWGYYTNNDSGLIHAGYRDYNPTVGRWMTEDPIGLAGGENLYAYCGNDPVNAVDPMGLAWWNNWDDFSCYYSSGQMANDFFLTKDLVPSFYNFGFAYGNYESGSGSGWNVAYTGAIAGYNLAQRAFDIYDGFPKIGNFSTVSSLVDDSKEFRSFTKRNFRENLRRYTEHTPLPGEEAHHVFPVKFQRQFEDLGVNINNPEFGSWVHNPEHQKISYAYNKAWESKLSNPLDRDGALTAGRDIASQFGIPVNF